VPCRFIPLHPQLPRRALLMPAWNVVLQARLHCVRQSALRAGVEVDFALEDFEARTNFPHLSVRQHEFPFVPMICPCRNQPLAMAASAAWNFSTSSSVL